MRSKATNGLTALLEPFLIPSFESTAIAERTKIFGNSN